MNITQQDARLILVLMGKASGESGIRPSDLTKEQAGVLIQALKAHAGEHDA